MRTRILISILGALTNANNSAAMTWDEAVSEIPKCKEVVAQAQVLAGEHITWTNTWTNESIEISCLRSGQVSKSGMGADSLTEVEDCRRTCSWQNGKCIQRCTGEVRQRCANYETRVVTADFLRDCIFPALKIYTTRTDKFSNLLSSQIHSVENAIPTEIAKQAQQVIESGSVQSLEKKFEQLEQKVEEIKESCSSTK